MRNYFAASAISALALAGPDWMYNDPWDRLEVTMDGQSLDLFIAATHWTDITA